MKLAWTSDLHLVFLAPKHASREDRLRFWLEELSRQEFDALAISGDISEAPSLHEHLQLLESYVDRPIYFVLGNHDYYRGSIEEVLPALEAFTSRATHLHCMDLMDYIELTPTTALVGHGCWGDGGYGDFSSSRIMMNDWKVIEELRRWQKGPWRLACISQCGACEAEVRKMKVAPEDLDRESIAEQLRLLGQRAADHIRNVLPQALEARPNVVLLTHAPPFAPRSVRTKISWDWWAPHAGCKAAGDVIEEIMASYPQCNLLILSGHVHSASHIQITRNIEQRTASAAYGSPKIEDLIELPVF
jgi:3',5'-cyclic AMP phosphodiesterase CpdA